MINAKWSFTLPDKGSNIGIIDADLLDKGTRFPNLALMKISGYLKNRGYKAVLVQDYTEVNQLDHLFLSKVFLYTTVPHEVISSNKVTIGGTGIFFDKAPKLPPEVEHCTPDYHLYDNFITQEVERGIKLARFREYQDYSIGFTTRGCFRKCNFCVNRNCDRVSRWASVYEFFDPKRKYIYLWDDNVLGLGDWREVFDELDSTGRRFRYRQGLDIRLMTEEKARVLASSRYIGDFTFAFDTIKDEEVIQKKLAIWRRYTDKTTKLYLLCAYKSADENDIENVFRRVVILMKFRCLPYIMRYDGWEKSQHRGMYINLARWCNQPNFFKKKSFREFCEANGDNSATIRYLNHFQTTHPEIANKYFDLRYDKMAEI